MTTKPKGPLSRSQIHLIFARHDVGLEPEAALQAAAELGRDVAAEQLDSVEAAATKIIGNVEELLISLVSIIPLVEEGGLEVDAGQVSRSVLTILAQQARTELMQLLEVFAGEQEVES